MNKVLNFVRLDFITVKPYFTLKNLIIFSVMPLVFIIGYGSGTTAMTMFMVIAVLYVSYPFAVGEKNGIDALYPTLSIKRGTVVLGRYLFALFFDLFAGVLAYIYSFVALTILRKGFNALEGLTVTIVLFIVFSIIQAIQLPLYFKLGYSKAKLMSYLPFMVFPLVVLIANNFLGNIFASQITAFLEWMAMNTFAVILFIIVIWLGIMVVSYRTSLLFYNKRDF
jgi:hypothetical protein